jgi:hypothetical protein
MADLFPLYPGQRLMLAKACNVVVRQANAGDDSTCRWCRNSGCTHAEGCPIVTLIDMATYLATGDKVTGNVLEGMSASGAAPKAQV